MAVTKRTRYEVLKRDNHTCRYCGASAPEVKLHVDHVMPTTLGGTDDPSNLVAACVDCNSGKASTSPEAKTVEDVKQSDLRWAAAMKEAAAIKLAERERVLKYLGAFDDVWAYSKPWNWEQSVTALYAAGLPAAEMVDAAYIATNARGVMDTRFVYFCGVAWRKVRAIQDLAKSILDAEPSAEEPA